MKKLIYNIIGVSLILLLTSCQAEEFNRPEIDLELLSNEVHLSIVAHELTSTTVNIKHGNSGYTVESSDESVAIATNKGTGSTITITGVGPGSAVVTVTDALGKTATIDVSVSVTYPTTPTFVWDGKNIRFDKVGGYALTVFPGKIALTDVVNDKVQYILSWTGGLTVGEKNNGTLKIVTYNAEPELIELTKFKVLTPESGSYYCIFSKDDIGGQFFFTY
ncbi:MAG: hypothetical protein PHY69_03310 [Dysgonamonadaceae bacterium]|nr:hypothetical protein [Dysgonamonadaceae bacterium]MDD3308974.1 hypothetical protein [Dysgonamonadaceae bacterium]MDD3901179.1 hypothetical protein [Dysgonamonadaceae bacterium]MDD4399397.1 hypothetical protein [Dysgonamonadaceae bacterium]